MHTAVLVFIGILLIFVSGTLCHEISGEGFLDDTGIGIINQYSTVITSSAKKELKHEKQTLHNKANDIIQFFLDQSTSTPAKVQASFYFTGALERIVTLTQTSLPP
jgi:hypothetical protein